MVETQSNLLDLFSHLTDNDKQSEVQSKNNFDEMRISLSKKPQKSFRRNGLKDITFELNDIFGFCFQILIIFCIYFVCLTQNYYSWTFLGLSLFNYFYYYGHYIGNMSRFVNRQWFLTVLFVHELAVGLMIFAFSYLVVVCSNFMTPIQIIASNKEEWFQNFGHVVTYKPIYGITIFFVPLLSFMLGVSSLMNAYIYYFDQLFDESIDRLAILIVVFHLLVDLALVAVLKFEFVWNNTVFVVFASITIIVTTVYLFICLYYILSRGKNDILLNFFKKLYVSCGVVLGLNCVLFIVIMCYYPSLYSPQYPTYAANYDSGFLKTTFNAEKFELVGDLDVIAECPKELIVFNWEDMNNAFGCLNIKTYYQGRTPAGFLLDCALAIPLFHFSCFVFLYFQFIEHKGNDLDHSKHTKIYQRGQEKIRLGSVVIISIALIGLMIYLLIRDNFTQSAPFTKEVISIITTDNSKYINQIIPSNPHDALINQEIEYKIAGSILFDESIDIIIYLNHPSKGKVIPTKTNIDFEIGEIYAYQHNIPIKYQLIVEMQSIKYDYGNIAIGGLLTGKHINLGDIPLTSSTQPIGSIEGFVFESDDFDEAITNVTVYVAKGYYYPSEKKEFIISDYSYKAVTDKQGQYSINNIHQGLYTLIIEKDNYHIETAHFSITNKSQRIKLSPIYLTELISSRTIGIALEWPNGPRDLDLLVTFKLNNKGTCVVGYMNKECAGVSSTYTNDRGGNKGIEMITINAISNYTYSVYVHKYKSNSQEFTASHCAPEFINNEEQASIDDSQLIESKARVKIHLPEYRFPLLNDEVPFKGEGNYWKVFELTPNKGEDLLKLYDEINKNIL